MALVGDFTEKADSDVAKVVGKVIDATAAPINLVITVVPDSIGLGMAVAGV